MMCDDRLLVGSWRSLRVALRSISNVWYVCWIDSICSVCCLHVWTLTRTKGRSIARVGRSRRFDWRRYIEWQRSCASYVCLFGCSWWNITWFEDYEQWFITSRHRLMQNSCCFVFVCCTFTVVVVVLFPLNVSVSFSIGTDERLRRHERCATVEDGWCRFRNGHCR